MAGASREQAESWEEPGMSGGLQGPQAWSAEGRTRGQAQRLLVGACGWCAGEAGSAVASPSGGGRDPVGWPRALPKLLSMGLGERAWGQSWVQSWLCNLSPSPFPLWACFSMCEVNAPLRVNHESACAAPGPGEALEG